MSVSHYCTIVYSCPYRTSEAFYFASHHHHAHTAPRMPPCIFEHRCARGTRYVRPGDILTLPNHFLNSRKDIQHRSTPGYRMHSQKRQILYQRFDITAQQWPIDSPKPSQSPFS
jgi:hypothetical protein